MDYGTWVVRVAGMEAARCLGITSRLVGADAGILDHLAPPGHVDFYRGRELFLRIADGLDTNGKYIVDTIRELEDSLAAK